MIIKFEFQYLIKKILNVDLILSVKKFVLGLGYQIKKMLLILN